MLTPATFHILLALAAEPRHGLGLQAAIAAETEGEMTLGPGTLYAALHRLVVDGSIEVDGLAPDAGGRRDRRKLYRLTGLGERQLHAELRRLSRIVGGARRRRLLPSEEPEA